jgi:hypothetical protein
VKNIINKLIQWQIKQARRITDKAVMKVLKRNPPKADAPAEVLCWSGSPGFVATFNSREFVFAVVITAVVTLISVIMLGDSDVPVEASAMMAVFVCSMTLLLIGWVRQVYRYIKTISMYYAVTDLRLVIIKNGRIADEIDTVTSVSVSRKFFGNGSIVFNEGEDYLKNNLLEAPPRFIFAFFNVLDVVYVDKIVKRL